MIFKILASSTPPDPPETLLRWHRNLFRQYWRHKSKNKQKKPRIPIETILLIRQMVQDNQLWGAEPPKPMRAGGSEVNS